MSLKLNKEEIGVGVILSIAWCYFMGWWSLIAVPLSGFLWSLGGAHGTSLGWRRYGVPLTVGLALTINLQPENLWLVLSTVGFFGCTTIGYGIPTWDDSGNMTDEGSTLGALAYTLVGGREWSSDTDAQDNATDLCRLIIGLLIGLAFIPLAWISLGGWILGLVICSIGYPSVVRIIK